MNENENEDWDKDFCPDCHEPFEYCKCDLDADAKEVKRIIAKKGKGNFAQKLLNKIQLEEDC